MPQRQVAESDFFQCAELPDGLGQLAEGLQSFVDRQFKRLGHGQSIQFDFKDFPLESFAVAFTARNLNVREELHLDDLVAKARARLAAPVSRIKGEVGGAESQAPRVVGPGKGFPDGSPSVRVERRVRSRRAHDRILVDHHDFGDRNVGNDFLGAVGAGHFLVDEVVQQG